MLSKHLGQFVVGSIAEPDTGQQTIVNAASCIAQSNTEMKHSLCSSDTGSRCSYEVYSCYVVIATDSFSLVSFPLIWRVIFSLEEMEIAWYTWPVHLFVFQLLFVTGKLTFFLNNFSTTKKLLCWHLSTIIRPLFLSEIPRITCVGRTGNSNLSHIITVPLDNISPIHLLRSVIRATMYSEHCTYCTNIWLKTESIQGQLGNLIVTKLPLQWTISHVVAARKVLLSRCCFESLDKKYRWKYKKCRINSRIGGRVQDNSSSNAK